MYELAETVSDTVRVISALSLLGCLLPFLANAAFLARTFYLIPTATSPALRQVPFTFHFHSHRLPRSSSRPPV